jgi:hypothetical protein
MTSKLILFRLRSELAKNGHLHEMHVCDNVGDHLQGNVYARYEWEAEASRAVQDLNTRWYAGKPLYAELSPVTDFKEACCRQNEMGECTRGGSVIRSCWSSIRFFSLTCVCLWIAMTGSATLCTSPIHP